MTADSRLHRAAVRFLLALAVLFGAAFAVGYARGSRCRDPECRMCARANRIP